MITLVIKGGIHAARNAAVNHGVKLTACAARIPPLCREWEVIASADFEALDRVRKWFASGPHDAPFPAGTLLHYSVKEYLA